MSATEYRVRWRRQGLKQRTKLYQDRAAAERWALILQGKVAEATGLDPEAFACCDGSWCGCNGRTNAEAWADRRGNQPELVELAIDERTVRPWKVASTYELPEPEPTPEPTPEPEPAEAIGDVPF